VNGNFENILKALIQVAKVAGVFDTPEFQRTLNRILLLEDIDLAQATIDRIRPLAIDRLLKGPQPFEPPDPDQIDGVFPIGIADDGAVFGLDPRELSMHVFITGSTGTGKSVIVHNILEGLRRYNKDNLEGIHYWVIDFMAEYRHMLRLLEDDEELLILRPKDFRFNPLQPPPGVDPNIWLQIVCDTFASSVGIFFGGKDLLSEFIDQLYIEFGVYRNTGSYTTISNLLALALHYHEHVRFGYRKRDSLETLIGRLRTIQMGMSPIILCREGYDLVDLFQRDVVLELHGLTNYVQNFFVNLLLQWNYNYRKASNIRGSIPNLAIVFDEAKRIFDANYEHRPLEPIPTIVTLVDEIRQFRTGLVVSDQEPTKVLKSLKANTYTKITLQIREGSDIKDQADSMGLSQEQKDVIGVLPDWTAIVKKGHVRPFLCQIPLLEPSRKDVSDRELDILMQPMIQSLRWKELKLKDLKNDTEKYNNIIERDRASFDRFFEETVETEEERPPVTIEEATEQLSTQAERIVQDEKPKEVIDKLPDQERGFLQHIIDCPFLSTTERYKTAGVNPNKGNGLHKSLEEKGFVEPVRIKRNKGRKPALYYSATEKAFECMNIAFPKEMADKTYGQFEHRFWKNIVFLNLEKKGLKPIQEYSKNGRRADIGCSIDGELVALEIGTSDARNEIANIKGDLEAGFDRVWAVCTEEVEKSLQRRIETELDEDTKSKVEVDLTHSFHDGKIEFPKKRKILFVLDGNIPKSEIAEKLKGRLTNTTLKWLAIDKVKEQNIEWADEILVMDMEQKTELLKRFPEAKVETLHIPKDEEGEKLEKLANDKIALFLE
jgi:predicted protein tyrosine phosphatase/Cdc6-like AAA superfamily ATPase